MHEHDGVGENPVEHGASRRDGTPAGGERWRRVARAAAGSAVLLAYAWWVVSLPPFSAPATAAVLVSGAGAVIAGRARRRPRHRPGSVSGAGAWAGLAAAAGVWELLAYVQHPRVDHPTLSSLANALLDSHPARAAAFVLWLLGAVELGRR